VNDANDYGLTTDDSWLTNKETLDGKQ